MRDFTVLVLSGAFPTAVCATLDILRAAAAVAPRVGLPAPTWRVVSASGGLVPLGAGVSVETQSLAKRPRADRSVWIVPGLASETPKAVASRLAQDDATAAARALRTQVTAGGEVAAACSAVFLLQAAGALEGRRVTTSWWLAPALQRMEPRCQVAADRMVCVDGPVTTAGAAFAQTDLMLQLLQAKFGAPLAEQLRRLLLIDAREAQAPYAVPALMASGNAFVARLTDRIEQALPRPPSVRALASEFAMSGRTLARHVHAATGLTPLKLVQNVRLQRARALIERSKLTIDQVAAEVGYEDATALRRLMRKWAGANPSRFRTRVASG